MNSERWLVRKADDGAIESLASSLGLPASIARVLWLRGVTTPQSVKKFIERSLRDLENPFELMGMERAAGRVVKAIELREPILIHGDFDADGITSTALLFLFLKHLGAKVFHYIPNRLFEGHGVSLKALDLAKQQGCKLMITCDCGSSNAAEIDLFFENGVETIVTDHHHVGDSQLTSAILVNPKHDHHGETNTDEEDMLASLAGVGVAFMLVVAVRSVLREKKYFTEQAEPNLKEYLDIVALGTVADMAPLVGQNRILVAEGLLQMAVSKRPIFSALRNRLATKQSAISTEDIGFKFAPRFNAAARLGHADEAFKALTTENMDEAYQLLDQLDAWNSERKLIQEKMIHIAYSQAQDQIRAGKKCIVVSSADFHSGVAGLVAQKLAESFASPVFVFTVEGEFAKASARSRHGYSIHELLKKCSSVLLQFGGHDEAGGCLLKTSDLPEFKSKIEAAMHELGEVSYAKYVDCELDLTDLNEGYFNILKSLKPFGMANPEPMFMAKAQLAGIPRQVGVGHLKTTLVSRDGRPFEAIGFGLWSEELLEFKNQEVEVIFSVDENFWQGKKTLQLVLKSLKTS